MRPTHRQVLLGVPEIGRPGLDLDRDAARCAPHHQFVGQLEQHERSLDLVVAARFARENPQEQVDFGVRGDAHALNSHGSSLHTFDRSQLDQTHLCPRQ